MRPQSASLTRPPHRRPQVIPDLGLGVTLYEILDVQGGTIYPLEGAALYTVTFSVVRLRGWATAQAQPPSNTASETGTPPQVVFRPFVGEVLKGKIVSADRRGLQVCEPGGLQARTTALCLTHPPSRCRWASSMTSSSPAPRSRSRPPCASREHCAMLACPPTML